MSFSPRIFHIAVAILLIIISIVHLGVGGSIIRKFQDLQGLYARETGLAGYNVFIGIVGLLVGGFGLIGILTSRKALSRVVAYTSIALVIFVLASWIAALVIHSSAIDDLNDRFSEKISQYSSDSSSKRIVDRFQITYQCCGTETPLEWNSVSLPTTIMSTRQTTTTTATMSTRQTTTMNATISTRQTTTTSAIINNSSTAVNNISTIQPQTSDDTTIKLNTTQLPTNTTSTTTSTIPSAMTTKNLTDTADISTTNLINTTTTLSTTVNTSSSTTTLSSTTSISTKPTLTSATFVGSTSLSTNQFSTNETTIPIQSNRVSNSDEQKILVPDEGINPEAESIKTDETTSLQQRRRKSINQNRDSNRLSDSVTVVLPQSCCISEMDDLDDIPNQMCTWMINSTARNSRQSGCTTKLGSLAVSQTLALAVINTFMLVLSLCMIAILLQVNSSEYGFNSEFVHESFPYSGREDFSLGGFNQAQRSSGGGYNNLNFGYSS